MTNTDEFVSSDELRYIELPSNIVRFHQIIARGKVLDTLAVMEDGQSVSLNALFGSGLPNA
jgi:hypothetical protein